MAVQFPKLLYDNRFADAAIVGTTPATGFALANVADWRAYTWYKPASLPAEFHVDCGSAKATDYGAVYGHNLGSKGCTVYFFGSNNAGFSPNTLLGSLAPTDDDPFVITWASQSFRYYQCQIQGGTAPSLAVVSMGAAFAMPRPLSRGFDPLGRTVQGVVNRSEKGHPLGRAVEFEEWAAQLDFSLLSPTWIRNTWLPAWRNHLRGRPFLFAWDPGDHADEVRLVTAGDSFRSATSGAYCSLSFSISGLA